MNVFIPDGWGINSYYESRSIMEKYPHDLFGNVNELSSLTFLGQLTGLDKLNYNQFSFFTFFLQQSYRSTLIPTGNCLRT
jgi:hypothetical protein